MVVKVLPHDFLVLKCQKDTVPVILITIAGYLDKYVNYVAVPLNYLYVLR